MSRDALIPVLDMFALVDRAASQSIPGFARRHLVRVCPVAQDFDSVTDIGEEVGTDVGAERVWERVVGLYRSGVHPAIQLCVRHGGEVVIDRSIGHARGVYPGRSLDDPRVVPLTTRTPINLFSAGKAVTGMLMHLLEERGLIDLDAPIERYVPEFGRHGKQAITLRHLLIHRAGIPSLPREALDLDLLADADRMEAVLCDLRPESAPGGARAYHAISGGLVMEAVTRRATGRSLRAVLAEDVKEPLGLKWFDFGVEPHQTSLVAQNVCTGVPIVPPLSLLFDRLFGMSWDEAVRLSNDPRFQSGVVPSGNVIVTARDTATFYQCLLDGGVGNGRRIFAAGTVERAIAGDDDRIELDRRIVLPLRYAPGFMLGTGTVSLYGWNHPRAFGHLGLANSFTWADPDRDLVVALLTTGKAVIGTHLPALVQLVAEIHRAFPAA